VKVTTLTSKTEITRAADHCTFPDSVAFPEIVNVQLEVSLVVAQAPDQIAVRSERPSVTDVPLGNVADPV
jgi:hypothetical protein